MLYNELTKSPSFHPFIIFALITLQYCGLSPIQTVGMMQTEEIVYLGATPINRVLTLGYLFLSIEHYMIYLGYFLYDNYKLRREDAHVSLIDSFSQYNINSLKVGVYNYLIVILLRSLDFFMPLATISSLLVTYANTGFLVSLSILTQTAKRNRLFQQCAGDNHSLNLAGSFIDFSDLGIPNKPLKRIIA